MQVVTALAPLADGSPLAVVAATSVSQIDKPPASEGELVNARQECERLIDKPWKELTFHEQAFISVYGDKQANFMKGEKLFNVVLLWFMWPATGLMIFSAITAVLLKWRTVIASFTQLRAHSAHEKREDVSLTTILVGSAILTVLLAVIQERNFGLSYVQTAVAVLCTLPLILVGNRVLGETNFGPISVMMNGLQAIFAVFLACVRRTQSDRCWNVRLLQFARPGDHSRLQDGPNHRLDATNSHLGSIGRSADRRGRRGCHVSSAHPDLRDRRNPGRSHGLESRQYGRLAFAGN